MSSIEHVQPDGLYDAARFGYTQVVTAAAQKLAFISGQTALGADFQVVGEDDLGAQARQALANLETALRGVGATAAEVTMLRIYVVDYDLSKMREVSEPLSAFFGDAPPSAQTLIGVQALGMPQLLIEIEAIAVIKA